ncbi:hypothetical protein RBH26_18575 [Natronolimnohabitans sp. A-GB9]|uniref:hypothetical protein n=1 Tax=Natronolimnohabitans sp. A-GB9 TaxID=3069757 RepID=UPI0027B062B6|nr:hypothetical protein [Natronolimnohabitans sp. A-GB9]MDQ2052473.1 hypothetical protein [Natronolimnohabitans sp. A-GB9]
MGSWDEVCITIAPDDVSPTAVKTNLQAALSGDDIESIPASYTGDYGVFNDINPGARNWDYITEHGNFEDINVIEEDGKVYVYGADLNNTVVEVWVAATLSLGYGDGWALVAYTQEAGAGGYGFLYEWDDDENRYVEVDSIEAPDGGYDDALHDYFENEHEILPRTYSLRRLDALPAD